MKHVTRIAALALLCWSALPVRAVTININSPGTPFSRGVRGQAAPAIDITRGVLPNGIGNALAVAKGSSIRGVAGGLEADFFNWETRNNSPRPSTLEYLRYGRDYQAELVFTANVRGLVAPDPVTPGNLVFTDTSVATVTKLAADWVRYTNHIVPTYRLGQSISNPVDQAILNSLTWSSATAGDSWNKLLPSSEKTVPTVKYWEIGNEPRVGLTSSYKITNSVTFLTPNHTIDTTHLYDYAARYGSMVAAMKAQDPTIKVGPCLQNGTTIASEKELLDSVLAPQPDGSRLPVDFISYHPYQKMGDLTAPADITTFLKNVYPAQATFVNNLRSSITASGRDPNSIELMASEVNVSNWSYNDTVKEAQMAHALGSVETVFSHARLGLRDSHYWIWPTDPYYGTAYPSFKAFEKLRDHMGDKMLNVVEQDNLRLYSTKDSITGELAFWGMNFDNDADGSLALALQGFAGASKITLMRLQALSGKTSLTSANLSPLMGDSTVKVDWVTTNLTGTNLSNYVLQLPASTITLLLVQPTPEPSSLVTLALPLASFVALRRRRIAR